MTLQQLEAVPAIAKVVGDHLATDAEAAPTVVAWVAQRFAGDPAPSNCGTQALLGL